LFDLVAVLCLISTFDALLECIKTGDKDGPATREFALEAPSPEYNLPHILFNQS
jgi:hypothetical protein